MKDDERPDKEQVATSASYGGHMINVSTWGNYTVIIYTESYPAIDLAAAKKMIDDVNKARRS
jgi:hypothetical protein